MKENKECKGKKPRTTVYEVTKNEINPKGRDKGAAPYSTPGINTPGIEIPTQNPTVPTRAWTAMRSGVDIEELSPEEKADLYLGSDGFF